MKLYVNETISGYYRQATTQEIIGAAKTALGRLFKKGQRLQSVRGTKDYLMLRLAELEHEVFCVLFLDNGHKIIAFDEMFRGTIDGASVHPREVVKRALQHNAAAVIFVHNHPSGQDTPSAADISITNRLKDGLGLVDIRVLDHFIVAGDALPVSFAERGLL